MLAIARLAARPGAFTLLLVAAACSVGCGESESAPPVALTITSPPDSGVVRERGVEVRGRVSPSDAHVLVRGRPATVDRGAFRAYVPLREGTTVIDVGAYEPGATPAWEAVRVVRQVLVSVPDLVGASRGDALEELDDLGLRARVLEEEAGLLDSLLPTDWNVCEIRPGAAARVPKGATVELTVSKGC
jgi:hypothetical protein